MAVRLSKRTSRATDFLWKFERPNSHHPFRRTRRTKGDQMNKALGIALLVIGVVLIVFGINATDSFQSDVSRFFTGTPTDKAIWLLIGGIASAIVGLVLSLGRTGKA